MSVGSFAVGVALGLAVGVLLRAESQCCSYIGQRVRDKVGDKLGGTAQAIGDLFGPGGWDFAGTVLAGTGIAP